MLQFRISPPRRLPKRQSTPREDEAGRPAYLILGAFASVPKIHFEEVKLGQSKKKTLVVRNPSDQAVWLKLCKMPSKIFKLSWVAEPIIEANGQYVLDITWTPVEKGQCFEAFQFQYTGSGIKFSVHLLGTCIEPPKAPRNANRRRPLISSQNIRKLSGPSPSPAKVKDTEMLKTPPKSSMTTVLDSFSLPFTPDNTMKAPPCPSKHEDTETLKTPPRSSLVNTLDSFSMPFTPDSSIKAPQTRIGLPTVASSCFRRETFLIEEESLFMQDQCGSPTRRETYTVPPVLPETPIDASYMEEEPEPDLETLLKNTTPPREDMEKLHSFATTLDNFLVKLDATLEKANEALSK